jgi:hypothetical protein
MTTFHTTASNLFARYIPMAALASFTVLASPALAAERWVACEGTVATTVTKDGKTETTNAPATDVYAYNDASKALFKYSDKRNTLDPVFVTGFDDKAIKWANAGASSAGSSAASWEGSIDRATLALKLTRTERGEIMTWTQQCKATSPKI